MKNSLLTFVFYMCALILLMPVMASAVDETKPASGYNLKNVPVLDFPIDLTISSAITRIIEHGDMQDLAYINHLLNANMQYPSNPIAHFKISQNHDEFFTSYISRNSGIEPDDVELTFTQLSDVVCVNYSDFESLFKEKSQLMPAGVPISGTSLGTVDYVFKKELSTNSYLYLHVFMLERRSKCALAVMLSSQKMGSNNN